MLLVDKSIIQLVFNWQANEMWVLSSVDERALNVSGTGKFSEKFYGKVKERERRKNRKD